MAGTVMRLAAGVLLAACAAGTPTGTPVTTTAVDLPRSYRFAPADITVDAGSTVTWTNSDQFTHNVVLPGEEPLTMAPGETASHTFATAGVYDYVCSLHPTEMRGTVTVRAP